MKYAYNTLVYGEEPIEKSVERIAKCGYDGVEFVGEPKKLSTIQINRLLNRYNIEASSICSIYTLERDLVNSDEIYSSPVNTFVAGFVGSPPMNFFQGTVRE